LGAISYRLDGGEEILSEGDLKIESGKFFMEIFGVLLVLSFSKGLTIFLNPFLENMIFSRC
jgi:hypothetical protein